RLPVSDPPQRQHDPTGVLAHHQALRAKGRNPQAVVASYAAARIRDSSAESWRGSSRSTDAARSQRRVDDADLHACRARAPEGSPRATSSARLDASVIPLLVSVDQLKGG